MNATWLILGVVAFFAWRSGALSNLFGGSAPLASSTAQVGATPQLQAAWASLTDSQRAFVSQILHMPPDQAVHAYMAATPEQQAAIQAIYQYLPGEVQAHWANVFNTYSGGTVNPPVTQPVGGTSGAGGFTPGTLQPGPVLAPYSAQIAGVWNSLTLAQQQFANLVTSLPAAQASAYYAAGTVEQRQAMEMLFTALPTEVQAGWIQAEALAHSTGTATAVVSSIAPSTGSTGCVPNRNADTSGMTFAERLWVEHCMTVEEYQARMAARREADRQRMAALTAAGGAPGGQWAPYPFNLLLSQPTTPGGLPPAGM